MQGVTSECSGANAREGASDNTEKENVTWPQRACLLSWEGMQQSCCAMTHWTCDARVTDMESRRRRRKILFFSDISPPSKPDSCARASSIVLCMSQASPSSRIRDLMRPQTPASGGCRMSLLSVLELTPEKEPQTVVPRTLGASPFQAA